ncbi:MAG: hypothetical protein RL069_1299 [Planctomycetota bacterium]
MDRWKRRTASNRLRIGKLRGAARGGVVKQSGVEKGNLDRWIRFWTLALLLISPWMYAGANWSFQWILFWFAVPYALLLGWRVIGANVTGARCESGARGESASYQKIPGVAWGFLALGCFAQVQAYRWWGAEIAAPWPLQSIAMQQWALGGDLLGDLVGSKLAMSVEPMTTVGASSSLFLCAMLVWGSAVVWGHRKLYPSILLAITLLGVLVGAYGVIGAFNRQSVNALGLRYGTSFSVFVSRNSAGAFLNIALAASLGVSLHRFMKLWDLVLRERGQGKVDAWPLMAQWRYRLKNLIELLDYRTQLIWLSTLFLAFCVPLTLSRGAFLSGLAALFVTIATCWPGSGSGGRRGAWSLAAFVTILIALLLMVILQVDQGAVQRIESLESIDISEDRQAGRLYIWGVSLQAALQYGLFGSGLGTFHVAALPFQNPSKPGWYYHAESMVAEILVTLGWFGALLVLVACVLAGVSVLRIYVGRGYREYLPLKVAGVYFLISQGLHACIDFAWILPGVYVPSCLMLGVISGGLWESHRAKQKLMGQGSELPVRSKLLGVVAGVGFAFTCLMFLLVGQRTVGVLAVAESLDRKLDREFEFPGGEKKVADAQVEELGESGEGVTGEVVERWMQGAISSSPYGTPVSMCFENSTMLRLLGQSIIADLRRELWERRPPAASSELAWNQTSPLVMRLALESAVGEDREQVLSAIGGKESLEAIRVANRWFREGRKASPLDWRLLWGRVSTGVEDPIERLEPFLGVLAKVSSHVPGNLTSASLLFHQVLDEARREELWRQTIRVEVRETLGVARVVSGLYPDDQVPLDVFPSNAIVLRKMFNEVFTEELFPQTHRRLGEKLMEASSQLPWTGTRKAVWMSEVARETGDRKIELENLELVLQLDRENVALLKRAVELLIDSGEMERAREYVKLLLRIAPKDPFTQRVMLQLAESSGA